MGVKVKGPPEDNLNRSEDTLDGSVFESHSVRRTPHPIDPLARRHGRTSSSSRTPTYNRQYSRQVILTADSSTDSTADR